MNKLVFGLVLGAVLGALDGLTALVSAPEVKSQILSIVVGSTFKGLLAGAIIGWFARKVNSLPLGILAGLVVGAALAYPIAAMVNPETGKVYFWEIMIPGALVGMIVGFATQRYRATAVRAFGVLLALTACAAAQAADASVPATPQQAFEQLKGLQGDWQSPDGVTIRVRTTGGGTAVTETLFPGTPQEMMSVYHMEGANLVLTHYCSGGNQPRMMLEDTQGGKLAFGYAGGSNIGADTSHIHQGWVAVKDADHYDAEWTSFVGGKPSGDSRLFSMTRKK
jgi:F0F1-type ATP synthase assembly protein I